jgi:hypothetical protein
LLKQRTIFFGDSPEQSPPKQGHNKPVPERRFAALSPEKLTVRFSNTTATQVGGYPLWDHFARGVNLNSKLGQHIKMDRGPNGFTAAELSRFFVDSRVLGSQRLMHVDRLRYDPMLVHSFGIDGLPSDETLGRYFKSFDAGHLASVDRLNERLNNKLWKQARRARWCPALTNRIVLDYDSSTLTIYGKQEGANQGRNVRRKDQPGFQPKFAFIGGLGIMVNQRLYAQSVNLDSDFDAFHSQTVAKLPARAKVWAFRADGALFSQERIAWCERHRYVYAIGAPRNAALLQAVYEIPESDWVEGVDDRRRPYSVARRWHQPKTWSKPRMFVVSRRLKDLRGQQVLWEREKYAYFAYVTDYPGTVVEQYQFAVERCTLEACIKESKNGFQYHFLPCQELDANRAYLAHVQMAYNLSIWWKVLGAPAGVNRWTIETLRERVLNICGNLKRRAGGWLLTLPAWWPWKSVYEELAVFAGLAPSL